MGHRVYIGRIDIDNLKVSIIFMFIFTCIQCNFIYILKLEVLLIVFLASIIFDAVSAWSSTSPKGFLTIELKFKDDPVWLDRVWPCCFFFSISWYFKITWSIKLCSHLWYYVLSKIWRSQHREIEIKRNRRSEELLKLEGGQKISIFKGSLPYEGEVRTF